MVQVNNSEFAGALAVECNLPFREIWKIIETILQTISRAMKKGESIELRRLGTFRIKQYGTYTGRNPRTGEDAISIKPKKGLS